MTSPAPKLLNPNILALLLTREDVGFLYAEAEKAQRSLFLVNHEGGWSFHKELSQKSAAVFAELFPSEEGERSRAKMRETLTLLQKEIRSLPVMKVTLAFPPSGEVIGEISRWARQKFDPYAVLEIEVNPAILGGAVVSFGGRYFDHSLRRHLQEDMPLLWPKLKEELFA